MAATGRLVIFDMDGTLIDSVALIAAAMDAAFAAVGRTPPGFEATRAIVGLSLPVAVDRLDPGLGETGVAATVAAYKEAFVALRAARGETAATPLFPGARTALDGLAAGGAMLGVATGKARRGLKPILDGHGLAHLFATTQTADDAPSKPHPGMALNALRETGVAATRAALVGDTSYDMAMARAAGVAAVGVAWGCHAPDALREAGAQAVIEDFAELDAALARLGLAA
jgi:phosphoglycolate phosphatase